MHRIVTDGFDSYAVDIKNTVLAITKNSKGVHCLSSVSKKISLYVLELEQAKKVNTSIVEARKIAKINLKYKHDIII